MAAWGGQGGPGGQGYQGWETAGGQDWNHGQGQQQWTQEGPGGYSDQARLNSLRERALAGDQSVLRELMALEQSMGAGGNQGNQGNQGQWGQRMGGFGPQPGQQQGNPNQPGAPRFGQRPGGNSGNQPGFGLPSPGQNQQMPQQLMNQMYGGR